MTDNKIIMEKIKIIPPKHNGLNEADRLELGRLLIKAGYTVRLGNEKQNNKTVYFVEFWEGQK